MPEQVTLSRTVVAWRATCCGLVLMDEAECRDHEVQHLRDVPGE